MTSYEIWTKRRNCTQWCFWSSYSTKLAYQKDIYHLQKDDTIKSIKGIKVTHEIIEIIRKER